jgi:uncharacterized protein (TIGR02001 family)
MWDLPPPDPGFEISVASRGMSKGIAQTEGVQVISRAFLQVGRAQFGGQWKNVSSPVADGEGAAFLNYAPKLGPYQLTIGAAYKFQTNVKGETDDDSWEFTAATSRKFGKVALRVSAIYSPDDLGGARRSIYLEGGPSFEIDDTTRLSANIGHRNRVAGVDYTSFNTGLTKTLLRKVTLDLRYYDTTQGDLGEIYHGRLVLSGRLAL